MALPGTTVETIRLKAASQQKIRAALVRTQMPSGNPRRFSSANSARKRFGADMAGGQWKWEWSASRVCQWAGESACLPVPSTGCHSVQRCAQRCKECDSRRLQVWCTRPVALLNRFHQRPGTNAVPAIPESAEAGKETAKRGKPPAAFYDDCCANGCLAQAAPRQCSGK